MKRAISFRLAGYFLCAAAFAGCGDEARPTTPNPTCTDQSLVAPPARGASIKHRATKATGVSGALPETQLASKDSVAAFFGGKRVKLALVLDKLYLVSYDGGEPTVTVLSQDDEGPNGTKGQINSPLFSPDGSKLAYGGNLYGSPKVSFVRDVRPGAAEAWRVPVDTTGLSAAEPHWVEDGGRMYIHFATTLDKVDWDPACGQLGGGTYRAEVISDSSLGNAQATGWPGAFKGGLSKDHRWAGTAFGTGLLWDTEARTAVILDGGAQQCNPSMNPYPAGSRHADYLMILAFGGTYRTLSGPVTEYIHENLWIYNRDGLIVWRAKLPDAGRYLQWQKPEWSTHPQYATATALYRDNSGSVQTGDLYAVRIGNLADADEAGLRDAEGYLLIAKGGLTESSFSHLWVEP
jgi:hypothetical protein